MLRVVTFVICIGTANLWSATIAINQPADIVLGQPDFTSSNNPSTPSVSTLNGARGVTVDPTTGKVFVADTSNNRVLRFASPAALANGADAEIVLGQPDFVSKGSATVTASTMSGPAGVAVDGYGTLWVADYGNQRALRFDHASSKLTGANADGVLGQPDFVTSNVSFPPTQWSLTGPFCIAANSAGTIWIADPNVNRVLRFDYASAKANGADADAVLGQVDFVSFDSPSPPTAKSMDSPDGVTVDANDNLWVVDSNNNRVLRFDNAPIKPIMDVAADAVIGQPKFTTKASAITRYGLFQPSGCGIDSNGTLWVSNFYSSRVLGFHNAATLSNGTLADVVLGQTAFDISVQYVPPTASSLDNPQQIAADADGSIWIASSFRVLRFHATPSVKPAPKPGSPVLSITGKTHLSTSKSKLHLTGTAASSVGIARVEYQSGKGGFRAASGATAWKFTARLSVGKNVFRIRAIDSLGQISMESRITVVRR